MAVMWVPAFEVSSGDQTAGADAKLHVEWVTGKPLTNLESWQQPSPCILSGCHRERIFILREPYLQSHKLEGPPVGGGPEAISAD